ncbi:tRNA 2-selenouridine(34) synthase MnmH [Maribellus sediminis]|uniref:tRNA 2-selenouridine(34) synthase MnmH n=1 Tax=Maribellus sediminis TaxID=2696285 RepID=UPI0014311F2C|nr:tRNA 2-selenouridine(34) synthase MnmH [Maribellus sediminis]
MPKILSIEELLPLTDSLPLIDVRSPAEYELAHIPGAVNIPIFNNDERRDVGIKYKVGGKENAVLLGLDFVGPKMSDFVRQAKRIARNKKVMVHCWRGGMRSASMAWLFETAGLEVFVLKGGYKAYRQYIREQFSRPVKMVVLGGYTGSGKTDILQELKEQGEQFLDIEGLANHRGSAFGPLGQNPQPSNEQFENDLADAWRKFDFSKPVWVEDESRQLGQCGIPDPLFQQLRSAPLIKIIISKKLRINRLVKEYGGFEKEALRLKVESIKKRLGGLAASEAIEALENGELATVTDITLSYYDKAYDYGTSQRDPESVFILDLEDDAPAGNAAIIKEFSNQKLLKIGTHLS